MNRTVNLPRNVTQDDVKAVQRMDTAALDAQVVAQYDEINKIIEAGRDPEQGERVCFDRAEASGEFGDAKASDLRERMLKLRGLADVGSKELLDRSEVAHAASVASRPLPNRTADMSPVASEVRELMTQDPRDVLGRLLSLDKSKSRDDLHKLFADAHAGAVGGSVKLGGFNVNDFLAVVKVGDATGVDVDRYRTGPVQMLAYPDVMVADLLPVVQCASDTDAYTFPRETLKTNAIAGKAEGEALPEQDVASADVQVIVKKFGGHITVTKEQLADVNVAESYINALLREKFRQEWGKQVVNGDGTGNNMTGILNQSGIKTLARRTNSNTTLLAHLLDGLKVLWKDSYVRPDIVAVNYDDAVTLMQTSTTQGEFIFGDPHRGMPGMLWGVPMIASHQIPDGDNSVALAMRTSDTFLLVKGVAEVETGWAADDILKQQRRIVISGRGNVGVRLPHSVVSMNTRPAA